MADAMQLLVHALFAIYFRAGREVKYVTESGERRSYWANRYMQALKRARGLIKRDIGDWLRIRTVPDITFKLDRSIERGARILQLMKTLEHEGEA